MAKVDADIRRIRGERLRKIRDGRRLTQMQAAEELDMTTKSYQSLERGRSGFSNVVLDKLHERWSVSIDYLLYGVEAEDAEVQSILRRSSRQTRFRAVISLITSVYHNDTIEAFDEEFALDKFIEMYGKGRD